jgi:hypothetical protein
LIDERVVARLLTESEYIDEDPPSARHPRVYALADMLDVPKLKVLATEKLQIQLKDWVATDFPAMVKEIYSSTTTQDGVIRDLLVTTSNDHTGDLLPREDFKTVMEEFGEFSAALVVAVNSRVVEQLKGCWNCNKTGGAQRSCSYCY